jgi:hypothetical protein
VPPSKPPIPPPPPLVTELAKASSPISNPKHTLKNPPNQKLPLSPKNNLKLKLNLNLLRHLQLILAFMLSN